jgi:hypothetical protein
VQKSDTASWPEGKVFKGGRNERPMTPRPAPPAPLGPLNRPVQVIHGIRVEIEWSSERKA